MTTPSIFFQLMKLNLMILSKVVRSKYRLGYEFIRRDRNRQGGGVGFYIKTSINFAVRSDLNVPILKIYV